MVIESISATKQSGTKLVNFYSITDKVSQNVFSKRVYIAKTNINSWFFGSSCTPVPVCIKLQIEIPNKVNF